VRSRHGWIGAEAPNANFRHVLARGFLDLGLLFVGEFDLDVFTHSDPPSVLVFKGKMGATQVRPCSIQQILSLQELSARRSRAVSGGGDEFSNVVEFLTGSGPASGRPRGRISGRGT
jgi:hypothetical protein